MSTDEFSSKLYKMLDTMQSYKVDNNTQLVKTGNCIELSARNSHMFHSLYSKLWIPNTVEFNMYDLPKLDIYGNPLGAPIKAGIFKIDPTQVNLMLTDYSKFDTKEFWNYLHSEWQYCDVITHSTGNTLDVYKKIKGISYNSFIHKHLDVKSLRNKKILEIGPGYGIFPEMMHKVGTKINYWCLDVVKRFEHDNFIVGNGREFPDTLKEKFDIIFMLDVYGHIPSEYMENYLRNSMQSLTDDGVIMLNTRLVENVCVFFGTVTKPLDCKTMSELADSCGFELERKNFYLTDTFTDSDITTIRRKKK